MDVTDNEWVFVYAVGWGGSIVSILGLLGNAFTLMVLTKKDFRQSNSTLYLIALCVYDTVFLASNLMIVGLDWISYGLDPFNDFNLKFTVAAGVVLDPIGSVLICASVYTTIALTVDRCIAVVKPLKWPSMCTRHRIKITLVTVFIWSAVYNIPFYLEFKYQEIFIPGLNKTYLLSRETSYSHTYFHTDVFLEYIAPIVTMVIPIVAIVIPNVIILVVLKRQQRSMENSRSTVASQSSKSNRLTAQVLFISGFTLVSRILHSASYIAMDDAYYINKCSYACACVTATSALWVNLNAAINFICYCLFGEKFRSAFVQTVCACFGRRHERKNHSTRTGMQRVFSTSVTATTSVRARESPKREPATNQNS